MGMIYYKDFDFRQLKLEFVKKRKQEYINNIFCFDIEVSSYFVDFGKVRSLNDVMKERDTVKIERIFDTCDYGAIPYIWQFSIDNTVLYGRELSEFRNVLKTISDLSGDAQAFIFVHNLAYEYAFLRETLKDDINEILLTEARKPLYFNAFGNIQFRCTYRLTNLSLAKWGQKIGVAKKTGDLDYGELRSPLTKLTEKELAYCEFDLRVMFAGLMEYREEYGTVKDIPLTQTGIVRREFRAINAKVNGRYAFIASCMPKTPQDISVQSHAFAGGLTLANVERANKKLRGLESFDIASAYPFQIFANKFPACGFFEAPLDAYKDLFNGFHHIVLITYKNLRAKYSICTLSYSKRIRGLDVEIDGNPLKYEDNNGKVKKAGLITYYFTEKDCELVDRLYDYDDEPIIHEHYVAYSDYIPKDIIEFMLGLYADKTLLKHSDPALYMRKKEMLNCIYGMMCTMPYHAEFFERKFKPEKKPLTVADIQEALEEFQNKIYKNVVPYSWGLYVTANQRLRIAKAIEYFCKRGESDKVCYIDTDSMKGFFSKDEDYFTKENKRILELIKNICNERGIDIELTRPVDEDGKPHPLGIWEHDASYYEFRTCGAKRYAYKETEDDKIHITIAGVPKVAGNILSDVNELKEGLCFDIFNSHKNLTTYLDGNNARVTLPDGYTVKNTCGINIRPTSYKLTFTDDYRELLKRYSEYDKL